MYNLPMPNRVKHGKKPIDESLATYSRSLRSKVVDGSKLEIFFLTYYLLV